MKPLNILGGRAIDPVREIAEMFVALMGSQDRVAELFGIAQSNVSVWMTREGADAEGPIRTMAARYWADYTVRRAWIAGWLQAGFAKSPELVRWVEQIDGDNVRRLLEREIETFAPAPGVEREAASELAAHYLGWGWATSGDYFGFYRASSEGLDIVTYALNSADRPRPAFKGDPIFGR